MLKVSSACENAQYILNADNEYRCIVDYAFTVHNADEWMVELAENKVPEAAQADCNSNDACMYVYWDRTGGFGDTVLACTNGEDSIANEVSATEYPRWDKVCPVLGCTDQEAGNYDDSATEDDGSCLYFTVQDMVCRSGIDAESCNYLNDVLQRLDQYSFTCEWNGDECTNTGGGTVLNDYLSEEPRS